MKPLILQLNLEISPLLLSVRTYARGVADTYHIMMREVTDGAMDLQLATYGTKLLVMATLHMQDRVGRDISEKIHQTLYFFYI